MAEKNSSRSVTMVPSQVAAISELVKVAPEAIVSRILLRSPVGSVTVFAFAAGQELAEHTAPFDALVQVVAGRLELTIGGRPVTVAGGELVVMPARVPHALRAAADSTMILTMLRDRGEG
jgi:quercetin dioxygenase-like cupin family protein